MKLYKVYLVYGKRVVMHLYWARNEKHVLVLMSWKNDDKPQPIIEEIPFNKEGGCCMCHHISDYRE